MDDGEARRVIAAAWRAVYLSDPPSRAVSILMAQAWLETKYGRAWRGAGEGSHNWGAIQNGRPPCDPATSFEHGDTSPATVTRPARKYQACFARYPDDLKGAAAFVRTATRTDDERSALRHGTITDYAAALYDAGYYEGLGTTRSARISNYASALEGILKRIDPSLIVSDNGEAAGKVGWFVLAIGIGTLISARRI